MLSVPGLSVPAWLAAQTDGKSSAMDGPGVTCGMTLTAQALLLVPGDQAGEAAGHLKAGS